MTEIVKPLNETITNVVNQIGEKYTNSTNKYVIAVREFSKEAENSINEGFLSEAEKPDQSAMRADLGLKPADDNSMSGLGARHAPLNE